MIIERQTLEDIEKIAERALAYAGVGGQWRKLREECLECALEVTRCEQVAGGSTDQIANYPVQFLELVDESVDVLIMALRARKLAIAQGVDFDKRLYVKLNKVNLKMLGGEVL